MEEHATCATNFSERTLHSVRYSTRVYKKLYGYGYGYEIQYSTYVLYGTVPLWLCRFVVVCLSVVASASQT